MKPTTQRKKRKCLKATFETKGEARREAKTRYKKGKTLRLRVYKCKACEKYHLTSVNKKRKWSKDEWR